MSQYMSQCTKVKNALIQWTSHFNFEQINNTFINETHSICAVNYIKLYYKESTQYLPRLYSYNLGWSNI